ncbi:MAG: hypothetical protein HY438_00025 [DPANN group archaeon]|nr:hypothetical protein [DPANN group archaeon]
MAIEEQIRGDGILTREALEFFKRENRFEHLGNGTYQSEQAQLFLYVKACHKAETLKQAEEYVALARRITELGVLHPSTRWGFYQTEEGKYQLFAITPKLDTTMCHLEKPIPGQKATRVGWLSEKLGRDIYCVQWVDRADPLNPNAIPAVRDLQFRFGSSPELAVLFNPIEASHADNWGYDTGRNTLYPVDIEVIDFLRLRRPVR